MHVQGKRLVAVAAAKRHMLVMTNEGDCHTWGHRVVTPRRVQLAGKHELCFWVSMLAASQNKPLQEQAHPQANSRHFCKLHALMPCSTHVLQGCDLSFTLGVKGAEPMHCLHLFTLKSCLVDLSSIVTISYNNHSIWLLKCVPDGHLLRPCKLWHRGKRCAARGWV